VHVRAVVHEQLRRVVVADPARHAEYNLWRVDQVRVRACGEVSVRPVRVKKT
jgi:hypothetical protein